LFLNVIVHDGCASDVYAGRAAVDDVLEVTEVLLGPLDLCFGGVEGAHVGRFTVSRN
jgi:hypothetical protein